MLTKTCCARFGVLAVSREHVTVRDTGRPIMSIVEEAWGKTLPETKKYEAMLREYERAYSTLSAEWKKGFESS